MPGLAIRICFKAREVGPRSNEMMPVTSGPEPLHPETFLRSGLRWDWTRRFAVLGADRHGHPLSWSFSVMLAKTIFLPGASIHPTLLTEHPAPPAWSAAAPIWIEESCGEEEVTVLEAEAMPAIEQCLARVKELDCRLPTQQELMQCSQSGSRAGSDRRAAAANCLGPITGGLMLPSLPLPHVIQYAPKLLHPWKRTNSIVGPRP